MEDYERSRSCIDSDCPGAAEPEEDLADGGVLRYFACDTCGTEFGYRLVRDSAAAGSCSLGIPGPVREAISLIPQAGGPVFLGGIGRRPELWGLT